MAPPPQAPDLAIANGEQSAARDGNEIVATHVSRADNAITVEAAGISTMLYSVDSAGNKIALTNNGSLHVEAGATVIFESTGSSPHTELELWLHSSPTLLKQITTSASGTAQTTVTIPASIKEGEHKLVIATTNTVGHKVLIALSTTLGSPTKGKRDYSPIIYVTIALAVMAGLVIPTTVRRRKLHRMA